MKKITRFLISLIISVLLLYLLLNQINTNDVWQILKQADINYLLIAMFFYVIMMAFRSIRFEILLKKKIKFNKLLPIVFVHSFLTNIIPFRMGELSYIYLLKKVKKQSYSKGLSSLLIARIFEFGVMIIVLIIAIIFSNNLPNQHGFQNIIPFLFIALILCVITILSMIFFHDLILNLLENSLKKFPKFIKEKLNDFMTSFKSYKSRKILFLTLIYSILTYLTGVIFTYYIILALNFSLPINVLIITITFSILSSVLPINGIAGLGTVEGIWALVLGYFGYSLESAVLLSLSLHIIQLIFTSVLGLIGWLKLPAKHHKIRS